MCGLPVLAVPEKARFLILRKLQLCIIINARRSSYNIPIFLSEFNENWIFSTDLRQIPKYQNSLKSFNLEPSCSVRMNGRTDWQTDRQRDKEIDSYNESSSRFSQFCESIWLIEGYLTTSCNLPVWCYNLPTHQRVTSDSVVPCTRPRVKLTSTRHITKLYVLFPSSCILILWLLFENCRLQNLWRVNLEKTTGIHKNILHCTVLRNNFHYLAQCPIRYR